METTWTNTRESLKQFASILVCGKCRKKPVNPVRYTNCGHFFCSKCTDTNSKCYQCGIPFHPTEIRPDHTILNLVRYCDTIADIIKEKNLWDISAERKNISNQLPSNSQKSKLPTNSQKSKLPTSSQKSKLPTNSQSSAVNKITNYIPKHNGKNINKRNPKGETPLHTACIKQQKATVESLLAAGANPNTKDHANWSPLQECVNFGYYEICELLLKGGAFPNIPGMENRTPLHEAAINNRIREAKLLLEYHANRNVYDQYGKKPIDYCCSEEMQNLLSDTDLPSSSIHSEPDLNCTLDQTLSDGNLIVYLSNVSKASEKLFTAAALKHKIKSVPVFKSCVTHVIVEADNKNITNLTYDVMLAILHGKWLLTHEWISMSLELEDIHQMELELFEVSGCPILGVPKRARENKELQKPRLFDRCYFYLALQANVVYRIGDIELTKEKLTNLITAGGGTMLNREPNPEDIDKEQLIPFHIARNPRHPLYRCTHYIIYAPGKDEPCVKYNMYHLRSLPLIWLIECIEKFALVNPSFLGL